MTDEERLIRDFDANTKTLWHKTNKTNRTGLRARESAALADLSLLYVDAGLRRDTDALVRESAAAEEAARKRFAAMK